MLTYTYVLNNMKAHKSMKQLYTNKNVQLTRWCICTFIKSNSMFLDKYTLSLITPYLFLFVSVCVCVNPQRKEWKNKHKLLTEVTSVGEQEHGEERNIFLCCQIFCDYFFKIYFQFLATFRGKCYNYCNKEIMGHICRNYKNILKPFFKEIACSYDLLLVLNSGYITYQYKLYTYNIYTHVICIMINILLFK